MIKGSFAKQEFSKKHNILENFGGKKTRVSPPQPVENSLESIRRLLHNGNFNWKITVVLCSQHAKPTLQSFFLFRKVKASFRFFFSWNTKLTLHEHFSRILYERKSSVNPSRNTHFLKPSRNRRWLQILKGFGAEVPGSTAPISSLAEATHYSVRHLMQVAT